MVSVQQNRVLITGGGSYLGLSLAAALLAEGAEVTLILREGNQTRLGALEQHVTWHIADVWDGASLKGRARGHAVVIHTVGSMVADPARGLTYHRLNVISARNVSNMCISDGVPHLILFSVVRAPWVKRQYVRAKHDAEAYLQRVGLHASIVRAPLTYVRGAPRAPFYQLMTLLGKLPPISWLGMRRVAPMPVDVLARGVARIALNPQPRITYYYAPYLYRLNTREERRGQPFSIQDSDIPQTSLEETHVPKRPHYER